MAGKAQGYLVAIHVPIKFNDGTFIDHAVLVEAKRKLARLFGGYSALEVTGGWVFGNDPSEVYEPGDLVEERMTRVWSYAATLPASSRAIIKKFCQTLAQDLGQEAIYLEVSRADVKFVGA